MRLGARRWAMGAAMGCLLASAACSGGGGSDSSGSSGGPTPPPPPPAQSASYIENDSEAVRFLTRTTFGPTEAEIDALSGADASAWVRGQLNRPFNPILPRLLQIGTSNADVENHMPTALYWNDAVSADDQLRQRMIFALSQIIVVSDQGGLSGRPLTMATYIDILGRNAFGNYRTLLEDITYSVAMAEYLTYMSNRKENPNTGRMPDENYAREVMQLFTIGLVELNMDGTPRRDGAGNTIPTYDNDDVAGLARVFTGLSFNTDRFGRRPGNADPLWFAPVVIWPDEHEPGAKTFLGTTIPAGTPGAESIDLALDALFQHPNTAPFVSRQLIQRFVTSSPDPAYVERVANVFVSGRFTMPDGSTVGTGQRGDLSATIAAILLDPSVVDVGATSDDDFGKVREPVIRLVHFLRAFDTAPVNATNERWLRDTSDVDRLGQHPFRSPSVFNFYRPGYVAPASATGDAGLTAPELQLISETAMVGYMNFVSGFIRNTTPRVDSQIDSFAPDYTAELALSEQPAQLVERLDMLLTGGQIDATSRTRIVDAITAIPIRTNSEQNTATDRRRRVELAIFMVMTSPEFTVQD